MTENQCTADRGHIDLTLLFLSFYQMFIPFSVTHCEMSAVVCVRPVRSTEDSSSDHGVNCQGSQQKWGGGQDAF